MDPLGHENHKWKPNGSNIYKNMDAYGCIWGYNWIYTKQHISGQIIDIIIFHQSWFPWNSRGFPETKKATIIEVLGRVSPAFDQKFMGQVDPTMGPVS